jgi:probable O-glycosylation ligase (exosortase A-associated)
MKDLLFILMFFPFIYLALKNPFIGLCAWSWTIMVVPKNMLWGVASDLRFTYILAIITIIGMFFDKDPFRQKPHSSLWWLMVLFLVHTGISNFSTMGSNALSWGVWSDFFKAIVFSTLIIMLLTTRNRIETFILVLLTGAGFNIFFEGMKFAVSMGSYEIIGIRNSMMTDNNLFALIILMILPLYLYIIPIIKQKYIKLGFIGLAGLSAICVIGSYSRGGFIGLLIVGSQVFIKSKRKILLLMFSAVFASTALFIVNDNDKWGDRMQTIENAEEDNSFLQRVTAWKLATVAALDNPFYGVGQDSMQHFHVWSYYYYDINKLDFIKTKNVNRDKAKAAHSIYFQVLGDAGFIGLLFFLVILIKSFFLSRSLAKNSVDNWIRELGSAIKIILVVYMTAGGLLSLAYYDLVYAFIAILISLESIDRRTKKLM